VRFRATGLGFKLNLSLLTFLIALGAAMALLIFFGFRRTQHDATTSSREGLEAQGRQTMLSFAQLNSGFAQFIVSQAVTKGHDAARYMEALPRTGGSVPWDASRLARLTNGALYDPSPTRTSDVWVPATVPLDEAALRDLRDSAGLDALFPALFERYGAAVAGSDTARLYFLSASGVMRSYPTAGSGADVVPVDLSPARKEALRAAGPSANPQRNVVWSEPHQGAPTEGLLITAYTPVYASNEFRGLIGVDLSLASLLARADAIKVTPHGYAFVIDRNGSLLPGASSDIVQAAIADINNRDFARVILRMRSGESDADRVVLNGEEVFVAYAPLGDVGGSLALVAPISDVTAEAAPVTAAIQHEGNRTVTITLATMAAFFALALAGTAWLNRMVLLQPIAALVRGTRAVADGDLDAPIPLAARDELGDLAISFNLMTDELRNRREALRTEAAERERAENELNALFAAMTDTVLVLDRDGTYLRQAPTRPARHPIATKRAEIILGKTIVDVLGERQATPMLAAIRRALDTGITETAEYSVEIEGELRWCSASISPLTEATVVWVARDITERVGAQQLLEQRVEERTRELSTLLEVARNISSTLELAPLLALVLTRIRAVAGFEQAAFMLIEDDALEIVSVMGSGDLPPPRLQTQVGMRFPTGGRARLWERVKGGRPVIIDDVTADTPDARAYRRTVAGYIDLSARAPFSWMAVPVSSRERVIGMVVMSQRKLGFFTPHHAELAMAIAGQAGIAVENARLYRQAQARTRELSALLDVSKGIAATLEPQRLVGVILEQLRKVIDYTGASVLMHQDNSLAVLDFDRTNFPTATPGQRPWRFSLDAMQEVWPTMLRGEPVIIDDVRGENDDARGYQRAVGDLFETSLRHVRSFLAVPLAVQDRTTGMLTVSHAQPGYFTMEHARLVRAIADQAALAIENARLFAETQARARETEALIRADEGLFRTLDLDTVFQALTDVVVDVLNVDKCLVMARDDAVGHYVVRSSRNLSTESVTVMDALLADQVPLAQDARDDGTLPPVVVEDIAAADPRLRPFVEVEHLRSAMVVPIRSERELHGRFIVAYTTPHTFHAEEQRLMLALADRAAVAIENALLYERAQQAASLEERQRLARDLHDSVSQALYGIALGARTARTLLDRNAVDAAEPLDYVLSLADAGLAEMRALIFELRPESLQTEGLVAAIEKQVAATRSRYGIEVEAKLCEEPQASLMLKEAVYRIAQEALHNTIKHAHATHVDVTLECSGSEMTLILQDNGVGFGTDGSFPGHMGLRSMRERAARVGGTISIESAPGAGTRIEVRVPIQ